MKIVTSCFFLIISLVISAQVDTTLHVARQKRDYNMTQFDKDTFEKNRNGSAYKFKTEYESILQLDLETVYLEVRDKKYKNFSIKTSYWKQTLKPKQIVYKIGHCIVGYIEYYNMQGNLIKRLNADAPFKVNIYQIAEYILQEEGVDLLTKTSPNYYNEIGRVYSVKYPYYEVRFTNKDYNLVYYRIDGTTGEVLYKSIEKDVFYKSLEECVLYRTKEKEVLIDKGDPNIKKKKKKKEKIVKQPSLGSKIYYPCGYTL